jgi:hypothetical protein
MSVMEDMGDMEIHIEISQSETGHKHKDTWWSICAEQSADIFQQYEDEIARVKCLLVDRAKKQRTENNEDGIMVSDKELESKVQYETQWPEGKNGTKIVDGKATDRSSYTLNFDTMEQKNNDTLFVRKFRVVNVLLPSIGRSQT